MEEIRVCSNWAVDGENKLNNLVTYCSSENMECCIENVTAETCVCLKKEEKDDFQSKPELEIKCKHKIKEVIIFSEGSLIEVFGLHDEYLCTCPALFIDDWEGMAVYQARITLPIIQRCKLKFSRLKEKSRLWLYSVQLLVTKPEESSNQLLFNFDNVNELMNNQSISERAERFKKMFEMHMKTSENVNNMNSSIELLLHEINGKKCSQVPKSGFQCQTESNISTSTNNPAVRNVADNKNELPWSCALKSYIDNRVDEMKDQIMSSLELKLIELRDEHNAKLDKIIKLLEEAKVAHFLSLCHAQDRGVFNGEIETGERENEFPLRKVYLKDSLFL